jgi:hypothetical protein
MGFNSGLIGLNHNEDDSSKLLQNVGNYLQIDRILIKISLKT